MPSTTNTAPATNLPSTGLPIEAVLPALKAHLQQHDNALLEAEPGAGKTTLVPITLLDEPWLAGQKILVLEPRRLAAKAAAQRMADLLAEPLGVRVGYRIRHESKVSAQTRIEIVTEGILTRMLQSDPSLEGIGLVIFDEFHERNLHSDLALALCLQGRELFRDTVPLKILVMSATLDTQGLEELLNTTTLQCPGRSYPIETRYQNLALKQHQVVDHIIKNVCASVQQDTGSILVFLPGQKEIRQVEQALCHRLAAYPELAILPLYGNLDFKQQQAVIRPSAERKIVLASAIAQTSLTIEGISVVIDSGLSREARFDANTGTTRLHTRRATQAESTQRSGRAGRLAAGIAYRWWSEDQHYRLEQQAKAEIRQVDLASLVIELARWGINSPDELNWLDVPPSAHWQQACDLLRQLGALEASGLLLTPLGESMAALPLEPRLARIVFAGKQLNAPLLANQLVTLLAEGDPLESRQTDIELRLTWLLGSTATAARKPKAFYQKGLQQLNKLTQISHTERSQERAHINTIATLLAYGFPDRIGKRQAKQNSQKVEYKLANGRVAQLAHEDALSQAEWLIALDIGNKDNAATDTVYLACELPSALFDQELAAFISPQPHLYWPKNHDALIAQTRNMIGKLCISEAPLTTVTKADISRCAGDYIQLQGLHILPWDDDCRNLQARLNFLYYQQNQQHISNDFTWPDCADDALIDRLDDWLGPYLGEVCHKNHIKKIPLREILLNQLDWPQQQALAKLAPERLQVPSGSSISVDYSTQPPSLEVKLQEMFGCLEAPKVAGVALKIALLSPARRPLAVTQDLPFFWQEVYPQVKKEMKGRYPKHPWPDDPLTALPTHKTKRALAR